MTFVVRARRPLRDITIQATACIIRGGAVVFLGRTSSRRGGPLEILEAFGPGSWERVTRGTRRASGQKVRRP